MFERFFHALRRKGESDHVAQNQKVWGRQLEVSVDHCSRHRRRVLGLSGRKEVRRLHANGGRSRARGGLDRHIYDDGGSGVSPYRSYSWRPGHKKSRRDD